MLVSCHSSPVLTILLILLLFSPSFTTSHFVAFFPFPSSSLLPHSPSFSLPSSSLLFFFPPLPSLPFCLHSLCPSHRYYMLPRPGIASLLPPSCSATASAASSPLIPTCSIRSTCHPPSRCRMVRSPHRTRGLAPCSSVTQSSRWNSTASR